MGCATHCLSYLCFMVDEFERLHSHENIVLPSRSFIVAVSKMGHLDFPLLGPINLVFSQETAMA